MLNRVTTVAHQSRLRRHPVEHMSQGPSGPDGISAAPGGQVQQRLGPWLQEIEPSGREQGIEHDVHEFGGTGHQQVLSIQVTGNGTLGGRGCSRWLRLSRERNRHS